MFTNCVDKQKQQDTMLRIIVFHGLFDPVEIVDDSGVHAVFPLRVAAHAPADDARGRVALLVPDGQRAAAVSLARVAAAVRPPRAHHVVRQVAVFAEQRLSAFLLADDGRTEKHQSVVHERFPVSFRNTKARD